jgi:hypothetical protein
VYIAAIRRNGQGPQSKLSVVIEPKEADDTLDFSRKQRKDKVEETVTERSP